MQVVQACVRLGHEDSSLMAAVKLQITGSRRLFDSAPPEDMIVVLQVTSQRVLSLLREPFFVAKDGSLVQY